MKRIILLRSNPVNPDPPVEKMALTLMKNGYAVTIIGWDRDRDYEIKRERLDECDNIEIIRFGIKGQFGGGFRKNFFPLIKFQKKILKWLIKNNDKYDIIHAFDFDTGFIANLCAKRYKKLLVYHILDYYVDSHGLRGKFLGNLIEKMERYVINLSDATIICTEKRKEQILGSNPKRLYIIHNTPRKITIDRMVSIKKNKINDYKIKIAYIGILDKGRLIRELLELVEEDKKIELHIGGFGPMVSEIEKLSKKNRNIFFYGKLPYSVTLAIEKQCDLMVAIYDPSIPNHRYSAPNKFYESIMLGKPIIMAKNTGFDDIIIKNNIGCCIEYSKQGLKEGIDFLESKFAEWELMKKRGKKLYTDFYSWEIMEERIKDLYIRIKVGKE